MVGDVHAASQLASGEGQVVLGPAGAGGGDAVEGFAQVGADAQVVAHLRVAEVEGREGGPLHFLVLPEPLGVRAVQREQRVGDLRAAPSGRGPDRHAQAQLRGDRSERRQVLRLVVQLVVHLRADDRAAVGVGQALQLGDDLGIEGAHEREVVRVVRARLQAALQEPVGEAAVAVFAVAPRSDADDDVESMGGGEFDEGAQVEIAAPVETTGLGLVGGPEDIRRNGVEASGAGVPEDFIPALARQTRVVDLAGDRHPGASGALEPSAVHLDPVGGALGLAERQMSARRRRWSVEPQYAGRGSVVHVSPLSTSTASGQGPVRLWHGRRC